MTTKYSNQESQSNQESVRQKQSSWVYLLRYMQQPFNPSKIKDKFPGEMMEHFFGYWS